MTLADNSEKAADPAPVAATEAASSTPVSPERERHDGQRSSTESSHERKVPKAEASEPATIAEDGKEEPEYEWLTGVKLVLVMGPLILVFFLVLIDTTIISTAIPEITNEFNSLNDIGWYTVAYQLCSAVLQPLAGKLYVAFKNKWTFIAFFLVFELGSLLCGVATSSKMLIVGRAIAGMGTAGLQNGAFTIIAASVPIHKRPMLLGICQGIAQLGIVFGPLVGGALTQYTTWRWCFWVNLPPGAVVLCLLLFTRVPDAHAKQAPLAVAKDLHRKLDLFGFALFAPAIIMLLLAMQWGGSQYPWDSATIIGLFCGFGAMLLVWFAWNWYRGDNALIPVSMVRKTTVWSACMCVGCLFSSLYAATYYLPIYFQAVKGTSPTMSGVYMLPSIIAALIMAVAVGKLVTYVGYPTPFSIASGVLMAVGYGLISTLERRSSSGEWIGYQILFGFGRGMGISMPITTVQNKLDPKVAPLAIALCMFFGMLFGALFLSASATIFTNSLQKLLPKYAPEADVGRIIAAGATGFREFVPASQLEGIAIAYARSVSRVFYLCAALGAVVVLFSFGLGWIDIRPKKAGIGVNNEQKEVEDGPKEEKKEPSE